MDLPKLLSLAEKLAHVVLDAYRSYKQQEALRELDLAIKSSKDKKDTSEIEKLFNRTG